MDVPHNSLNDPGPIAEINITPLVDVMLVLLVIFMVTVPLMENQIPIELPKTSAKTMPSTDMPVTLTLSKNAEIFLNRDPVNYKELSSRLGEIFRRQKKKEILIRADGALPYAIVASCMALVKNAGIHRIGLITLPEEREKAGEPR